MKYRMKISSIPKEKKDIPSNEIWNLNLDKIINKHMTKRLEAKGFDLMKEYISYDDGETIFFEQHEIYSTAKKNHPFEIIKHNYDDVDFMEKFGVKK